MTGKVIYVEANKESGLRNHCCRGKTLSTKYYE